MYTFEIYEESNTKDALFTLESDVIPNTRDRLSVQFDNNIVIGYEVLGVVYVFKDNKFINIVRLLCKKSG